MKLVHEDLDFADLIAATAKLEGLRPGLVEKDYWVTHVLWSLQQTGLECWFKGGTSLSKAFGLIERFSEDLDLMIESGRQQLPKVASWSSVSKGALEQRRRFFDAMQAAIRVSGVALQIDPSFADPKHRQVVFRASYPAAHASTLGGLRPFVQLEVGQARVTPFVLRGMTSFVHVHLARLGMAKQYLDNRPSDFRCLHPLVTLLEKLDALQRRTTGGRDPSSFVRHYEDVARIIERMGDLPPLGPEWPSAQALADDLLRKKQIASLPDADHLAFTPNRQTETLEQAHAALADMFWRPQLPLRKSMALIRAWIADEIGT